MLSSVLVIAFTVAIAAQGPPPSKAVPSATPVASPGPGPNAGRAPTPPPRLQVPPNEIHGEVLRPDGKPAARARVGFFALPGPGLIVPAPAVITADEQGVFRFETKGLKEFYVRAHLPPFAPAYAPKLAAGKRVRLKLVTGTTLTGDVLDAATGKPIAGAALQVSDWDLASPFADADAEFSTARAKSDPTGRFTIQGAPADGRPTVRAEARGYASETSMVTSGVPLKFRLSPGRDLPGLVTDAAGRPVPKATITLRGQTPGLLARSGPDGRFELRGLRPASYDVFVNAEGFAPFRQTALAQDTPSLRVALQKPSIVTGRIVDEEGKPRKGMARLRSHDGVQVTSQFGREAMAPVTDDGRFTIKALLPGTNIIQIAAMGFPPVSKTIEIAQAGETVDLGDVVLESGLAILGRVLDKAGQPIVGARVQVSLPRTLEATEPLWAESDAEGRFSARGLKAESHDVFVNATGFATLESKLTPSPDEQALVMKPSVRVTGRIVDPESAPVARAMITIQKGDDRRTWRNGQTTADGRFSIDIAEPGAVTVTTSAEFFERSFRNVTVAGDTDLGDLMLSRGLQVRGVVVDSDGAPIEGARVENQSAQQFPRTTVVTDSKGAFEMRGASPGRVRLVASHREYSPAQIMLDMDESGRDPGPVRLTLTKGGRIEGVVQMRDGTPVANARLQLLNFGGESRPQPSGAPMYSAVTSADGTFTFERCYPETVRVTLMAGQGGRYTSVTSVEVKVIEGETARVALTLRSTVVRGVVQRNGRPGEGLRVSVFGDLHMTGSGPDAQASLNTQIPWTTATTDAQGRFALQVAGPFKGRVQIEDGRGGALFWKPVEVPDVEEFPLDIDFGGARATGRVLDKATGQGIAQARVSATRRMEPGQTGVTSQSRTTGPAGEFTLEVEPGDYRVSVSAASYAGAGASVAIAAGETSLEDISLDRGGTLLGRALLPNGRPAAEVQVRAMGGETFVSATSGLDGSFTLRGLPEGPFSITATDFNDHIVVMRVEALTEEVVELRLTPAAKITATVMASPDILPRTTVAVSSVNGAPYMATLAVRPDARGVATLNAPQGMLTVTARSPTHEGSVTVQVQPGESTAVVLEMKPRAIPPKQ